MSNDDPDFHDDLEPRGTLASQIVSALLVVVVVTGVVFAVSDKGRQMSAEQRVERTTTGSGGAR